MSQCLLSPGAASPGTCAADEARLSYKYSVWCGTFNLVYHNTRPSPTVSQAVTILRGRQVSPRHPQCSQVAGTPVWEPPPSGFMLSLHCFSFLLGRGLERLFKSRHHVTSSPQQLGFKKLTHVIVNRQGNFHSLLLSTPVWKQCNLCLLLMGFWVISSFLQWQTLLAQVTRFFRRYSQEHSCWSQDYNNKCLETMSKWPLCSILENNLRSA